MITGCYIISIECSVVRKFYNSLWKDSDYMPKNNTLYRSTLPTLKDVCTAFPVSQHNFLLNKEPCSPFLIKDTIVHKLCTSFFKDLITRLPMQSRELLLYRDLQHRHYFIQSSLVELLLLLRAYYQRSYYR